MHDLVRILFRRLKELDAETEEARLSSEKEAKNELKMSVTSARDAKLSGNSTLEAPVELIEQEKAEPQTAVSIESNGTSMGLFVSQRSH